jgi:isoleucyl-tRNA synthetase
VILESWIHDSKINGSINIEKWAYFYKIKDVVYAELEKIRTNKIINKNNQALVEIRFDNKFNFDEQELAKYLNVAKVKIIKTNDEQIDVSTSNANLVRCERCWNYYEKDEMHDEQICKRCDNVLRHKSS